MTVKSPESRDPHKPMPSIEFLENKIEELELENINLKTQNSAMSTQLARYAAALNAIQATIQLVAQTK